MLRKLRKNYKRLTAFMLTLAMTFTNVMMNLNVAFAAGEEQEALFLVDGTALKEAIREALDGGQTFRFSSLELKAKSKSLKTSYEKLIGGKNGAVYQLDVEVDERYAPEDTSIEIFYNAGTEDVIFLFINESDLVVRFRANVDGYETERVTVNPNAANVDDTEASYVEDYSNTIMIDDMPHTLGAQVLNPAASGENDGTETTAASGETGGTETTDASGETGGTEATDASGETGGTETTDVSGEDGGAETTDASGEAGEPEGNPEDSEDGLAEDTMADKASENEEEKTEIRDPETEKTKETEPEGTGEMKAESEETGEKKPEPEEIQETKPEPEESEAARTEGEDTAAAPKAATAIAAASGEGGIAASISVRKIRQVASGVGILYDTDPGEEPENVSQDTEPEFIEEDENVEAIEENGTDVSPEENDAETDEQEESQAIAGDPEESKAESEDPEESKAVAEDPEESKAESEDPEESKAVAEDPEESQTVAEDPEESEAGSEDPEESKAVAEDPEESKAGSEDPEESQAVAEDPEESKAGSDNPEEGETGTSNPAEDTVPDNPIKDLPPADSATEPDPAPDTSGRDDEDGQLLEDDDIEILGELEGREYDTVTILDGANARAWKISLEAIEAVIPAGDPEYAEEYYVEYHVNDPEGAAIKGADHIAAGKDLYFAIELKPGYEITAVYANGTELEEADDLLEQASASDWKNDSHVYMVEHVQEDLWISADVEKEEKTIGAAVYTGETEDALFTVNAPEGAFEEEVRLQVTRIDDPDHIERLKAQARELLEDGQTIADILVYDVAFISRETGEEIEPARRVRVSASMKTPVVSDETAKQNLNITGISVVHLPDDKAAEIVAATDNAAETSFEFQAESFSEFMILATTSTELASGVVKIISEKNGETVTTYYATLQEAIDAIGGTGDNAQADGAEIVLLTDIKDNFTSANKNYTLDLDSHRLTTGEMGKSICIIKGGTVTIKNGTIHGAYKNPDRSGSVRAIETNGADLYLENCRITENEQQGINASKGSLTLVNCAVSDNGSNGIYASGCPVTISGKGEYKNNKGASGSAIYVMNASLTMDGGSSIIDISGNSLQNAEGGAIYVSQGEVSISNVLLTHNTYGAIVIKNSSQNIALDHVEIAYNAEEKNNSALYVTTTTGTMTADSCKIHDNKVTGSSSTTASYLDFIVALYGNGTKTFNNCQFDNNTGNAGARTKGVVLVRQGRAEFNGCTFTGNRDFTYGSVIYADKYNSNVSTVILNGGSISGNSTKYGAVYAAGYYKGLNSSSNIASSVQAKDTVIRDNTATDTNGGGVYLANSGSFTMESGAIYNNTPCDLYSVSGAFQAPTVPEASAMSDPELDETYFQDYQYVWKSGNKTVSPSEIYRGSRYTVTQSLMGKALNVRTNQTYDTLNAAVNGAESGDRIRLLNTGTIEANRITSDAQIYVQNGKVVTIELNGFTVEAAGTAANSYNDYDGLLRIGTKAKVILEGNGKLCNKVYVGGGGFLELNGNIDIQTMNANERSKKGAPLISYGNVNVKGSMDTLKAYMGNGAFSVQEGVTIGMLRLEANTVYSNQANPKTVTIDGSIGSMELTQKCDLSGSAYRNSYSTITINGNVGTLTAVQDGVKYSGAGTNTLTVNGRVEDMTLTQGDPSGGGAAFGRTVIINGPIGSLNAAQNASANTSVGLLELNNTVESLTLKHSGKSGTYYPVTRAGKDFFAGTMTLIPAIPSREGVTRAQLIDPDETAPRPEIVMIRLPEGYEKAEELAANSDWRAPEENGKPITVYEGVDYNYLTRVAAGEKGDIVLAKGKGVYVYLDPENGDNSNTGLAAGQPVRTLEESLKVLKAAMDQGILKEPVIYVKSALEISGDQTLDCDGVTLQRYPAYKGALIDVKSGALTLKTVTIDGSSSMGAKAEDPLISVSRGAVLNVTEGAVLQNNDNTAGGEGGAVWNNGVMKMSGGTIQGNKATHGGGVYTGYRLEFTGGSITNNMCGAGIGGRSTSGNIPTGGGVYIFAGTMEMGGGEISGNQAGMGGGISIGNVRSNGLLTMTGGTISSNTATEKNSGRGANAGGGGIRIEAGNTAVISGGSIINNACLGNMFGGGGIYVNGDDAEEKKLGIRAGRLELTNVLISGNEGGAGVAVCEDGDMKVYLTDGGIIHGNTSGSRPCDLYAASYDNAHGSTAGPVQKKGELYVSRYMLGDGAYLWRDCSSNELVTSGDLRSHIRGINVYSSAEKITGEDRIQVRITGNSSATTGSGVGGNGDIIIGKNDPSADRINITVKKHWNVELDEVSGIRVTYDLWSKPADEVADGEIPGKDTGWTLEDSIDRGIAYKDDRLDSPYWPDVVFADLPGTEPDSGRKLAYQVTERADADGRFLWESIVKDPENENTFIISNKVVCSLRLTKRVVDMYENESAKDTGFRFTITLKHPEGEPYTSEDGVTDQNGGSIVFDADGTLTAELKDGETLEFCGLEKGSTYSIQEEKNEDYNTSIQMSWGSGTSAVTKELNGTVAGSQIQTIGVTNVVYTNETKEPHGSLTITKTVNGITGDREKPWTFHVKLMNNDGEPLEVIGKVFRFKYVKYLGTSEEPGEVRVEDGTAVFYPQGSANGSSSVSLAHGQKLTIDGLPVGARYLVTEEEANTGGYITTIKGQEGTIAKKENHEARFTNTQTGGLTIHKTVEGAAGDTEKAWEFAVNLKFTDQQGNALLAGTEDPRTLVTYKKYKGALGTDTEEMLEEGNIPIAADLDETEFTVALKHGEYVTIRNLPTGTQYQVIEKEANTGSYITMVNHGEIQTDRDLGVIQDNGDAEVHFINRAELTEVEGKKVWEDDNNQNGQRPQAIKVNLLADGRLAASLTVTASGIDGSGQWSFKFPDLPRYENGKEIVYTVTEDAAADYSALYSRAEDGSFIITNRYTPGLTSYTVRKQWDDQENKDNLRPESIRVQLMQNGTAVGEEITLNQANNWFYEWRDLPRKQNGKDVEYKAVEVGTAAGYTVTYAHSGNVTIITNTHTPTTPPPEKPDNPGSPGNPGRPGRPGNSGSSDNGGGTPPRTTVTIDPETVPLASLDQLDDDDILTLINDDDVPLVDLPKTGHGSSAALMFMLSGMMLAAFAAVTGRKEEE